MLNDLKHNSSFQIRENLEGKNEKILKIECVNCSEIKKDLWNNIQCLSCLFRNLYYNKDEKFEFISLGSFGNLIDNRKILFLFEYFKKIKRIKVLLKKIEKLKKDKCKFKEFNCKTFSNYKSFFNIDEIHYYNPISLYLDIQERVEFIKNITLIDSYCQSCYQYILNSFELILKVLNDLKIVNEYINFEGGNDLSTNISDFYQYLFIGNYFLNKKKKHSKLFSIRSKEEIIEVYKIGKYKLFQISIFNVIGEAEKKYDVKLAYLSLSEKVFIKKTIESILNHFEIFKIEKIIPIETLIKMYQQEALKILKSKFNLPNEECYKIAFLTALRKLNLSKLFPLLIDDYIEEIFLDSPNTEIYINHQKHGRCRTEIRLTLKEIERIKTFLRLYSKQRLDFMNPSIKYVMKNKYFYCRFALDVEPINVNDFALDIRKLNKNILTIQDLLKNETLSPLMAAFLYFNMIRRVNLTVTGETDTGKTTLINAFDLLTPKEFRKIYVENVEESLNQSTFEKHQLKYQADSLDDTVKKYSKSSYIKTLLHRTPDIIFLGEILTIEESEALFHCLAAGLRGFQTIHSNTIDSLINRFLYHFKINPSCLNDLDLIILMKKNQNERRIVSIAEIDFELSTKDDYYKRIFQYNPESKNWDNLKPLYETNIIKKLKKYEDINKEKFKFIISIYLDIFTSLLKIEKIKNEKLVDLFHKISFLSFKSIDLLIDFWERWKKKRGLNSLFLKSIYD